MKKISVVLMASGYGKRYGKNKLLESLGGRPLYTYGVECALESGADDIAVVTRFPEIKTFTENYILSEEKKHLSPKVKVLWNEHPERGISESLKIGLCAVQDSDGCCFMVCDQPLLNHDTVRELFAEFRKDPSRIYVCRDENRRGNPVIFPQACFPELLLLQGDSGGKQVMKNHPEKITEVYIRDSSQLEDIDSAEDKLALEKKIKNV